MSVLVPFETCVARPDEEEHKHLLKDHLLKVKIGMENWIYYDETTLRGLMGLSGICHDVAKAHTEWQVYINRKDRAKRKGPTHAPAGAFLFSFVAYHLLKTKGEWEKYRVYWLWLIRDLADHHGYLKNLRDDRWIGAGEWTKMDLESVQSFIQDQYVELNNIRITEEHLDKWSEEIVKLMEEALDDVDIGYEEQPVNELMKQLQLWRHCTTALIAADRFDVRKIETAWLDHEQCLRADHNIDTFCLENNHHPLSSIRLKAQHEIMEQLSEDPDQRFYTLEMPTGYGKTITSLKLASWFGVHKKYRKIVYVAPYLSILEQTSKVIEEAMRIGVLEHHSLAILEEDKKGSIEKEQRAPSDQLAMEGWAHSIVCTSFQQWSKAMFPGRAQDVLRRSFLQDSVVIIDEPQIFQPEGWNVFLCGLEAMANLYNLRVIFLSATMPPFKYGLTNDPKRLSIKAESNIERYEVVVGEKMDQSEVAQFLEEQNYQTQAAILNTIEDAYMVYESLSDQKNVKLVHGLMIPIHKKLEIIKIQHALKQQKGERLFVISTQVLEAGVDVSFEHVVRALPILPSIIQAAGRVNRHAESGLGRLTVIPFLRNGVKDTRNRIYPTSLQKLTEQFLFKKDSWLESEMTPLIQDYYEEMFRQNTFETAKQTIYDAFEGTWEPLGQFQPFGSDYMKLPLFIPWQIEEENEVFLPRSISRLQELVGVSNPEQLYEQYRDPSYMQKLSFEDRKRFMMLLQHYVLSVPMHIGLKVASREDYLENKIPCLYANDAYDKKTGLTKHYSEDSLW
jgi:CRISPR-associated endonuclease/helicase Cas3